MQLPVICLLLMEYLNNSKIVNTSLLSQLHRQHPLQDRIFLEPLNDLLLNKYYGFIFSDFLDPSIDENDIEFFLYTNKNPENPYGLKIGDVNNLKKSLFNPNVKTKIIIHGWTDMSSSKWIEDIRHNYFSTGNYNIICVDWFPVSLKEYSVAAKLTRQIGNYVGDLINYFKDESNISISDVHILGHSLGAHIAGFAGSKLSGAIGRITGMDPARPLFEAPILKDVSDRLDETDAVFVDVIHTCGGTVGFINPIGHADFYPNGGMCDQPGCYGLVKQTCSHGKSYVYMIKSIIHPEQFHAVKCLSWTDYISGNCPEYSTVTMGEYLNHDARGTYFLDTT